MFIASGHFCLAVPGKSLFFVGLACTIIGTGFHKPIISTMVGQLFKPGDHRLWLDVGELRREYLVHVPPSYDGFLTPAVLMFHGSGGSLDEIARATGWIAKSDEEGFLAVFPNGFPNDEGMRVWNDGRLESDGRERVDDVAFTEAARTRTAVA